LIEPQESQTEFNAVSREGEQARDEQNKQKLRQPHRKSHSQTQSEVRDFQRKFDLPAVETEIVSFMCALLSQNLMIHQGRLHVTQNFICFAPWVSQTRTQFKLSFSKVDKIYKRSYIYIPNSIEIIEGNGTRHFLTSFIHRDGCYQRLCELYLYRRQVEDIKADRQVQNYNPSPVEAPKIKGERDDVDAGADEDIDPAIPTLEDDEELKDGSFEVCVNTTLPCSIDQVHDILWKDTDRKQNSDLQSFWQAYSEAYDDKDVSVEEWIPCSQETRNFHPEVSIPAECQFFRSINLQKHRDSPFPPAYASTRIHHYLTLQAEGERKDRVVVVQVTQNFKLPYCENFKIWARWVFTALPRKRSRLQIGVKVVIVKPINSYILPLLKSNTVKETSACFQQYVKFVKSSMGGRIPRNVTQRLSQEIRIPEDEILKGGSFEECVDTTLPCNIDQVHDIMWMDQDVEERPASGSDHEGATNLKPFWQAYGEEYGDKDIQIQGWKPCTDDHRGLHPDVNVTKESDDDCLYRRCVFQKSRNSPYPPAYAQTRQDHYLTVQKDKGTDKKDRVVVVQVTQLQKLPYCDNFKIHSRWVFTRKPRQRCRLQIGVKVVIVKPMNSFILPVLKSNTIKENSAAFKDYVQFVKRSYGDGKRLQLNTDVWEGNDDDNSDENDSQANVREEQNNFLNSTFEPLRDFFNTLDLEVVRSVLPGSDHAVLFVGFLFFLFVILYQYWTIVQIHATMDASMKRLDTIEALLLDKLQSDETPEL